MKKLELKHLAPYLPYGLKFECFMMNSDKPIYDTMIGIDADSAYLGDFTSIATSSQDHISGNDIFQHISMIKPIFRPLSDLTKEIEINGEKVVFRLEFNNENVINTIIHNGFIPYGTSWKFVEKLFEWHFDVFNLIPEGLAIDINTL